MKTIQGFREQNLFSSLKHIAVFVSVGMALVQFGRFLYIALSRIAYPFTLEWMEGGSFVQVSRILAGQPLYVRPSFEFIPQIYPPVYFYFSALVDTLLGNGFLSLRLVSIVSTLGILYLIFSLVRQQTKSHLSGVLAIGLFCGTYQLSGYWFDIARVDSLALALSLLSVYLLLKDNPTASLLGGVFLALSCFTKQTMLIVAIILAIYCILPPRKNNIVFIGTALLSYVGGTLLLDWLHEGWYSYYIFHLPGRHSIIPKTVTLLASTNEIFFDEMVKPIFFASIISMFYLFVFPGGKGVLDEKAINLVWKKKAVWALVLVTGVLAFGSLFYLASLPSDTGGLIGGYSLARLLLMAGPFFVSILVFALANKLVRNPSWLERITSLIYGNVHTVPRLVLGCVLVAALLIIIPARIQPDIYTGLSTAHLQRLSPYLAGPIVLMVVLIVSWRFLWSATNREPWFFLILGSGLIAVSWLGRLNPGGYYNVFMPAHAGISILYGLGIGTLYKKTTIDNSTSKSLIGVLILLLSGVQFVPLLSPPADQIPVQADQQAGQELVERIKACPGNVYVPFHTYLAELAGKDGYAGVVEMGELRGSFGGRPDLLWDEVLNQIQMELDAQTFAVVIQDNQVFRDATSPNYIEFGKVFQTEHVFWTITGRKIRPEVIYEPTNSSGCLLGSE